MRLRSFLTAAVLLSGCLAARASELYTFNIDLGPFGSQYNGTYTFSEPTILTAATTVQASQFTSSSGNPLLSIFFNPTGNTVPSGSLPGDAAVVELFGSNGYDLVFGFSSTLTGNQTYHADAADATTLTISSSASTTPEPSSLALLGTGLVGVVGMVRRRHGVDPFRRRAPGLARGFAA